jgi:putative oxidoreductase
MFGWFGGQGFNGTITMFSTQMGIPKWATILAIIAEFAGGLGLILGVLTRLAAFGSFCTMIVATVVNLKQVSSITATATNQNPIQGFAYPLLIGAIAFAIMLMGAGDYALDKKLFARGSSRR